MITVGNIAPADLASVQPAATLAFDVTAAGPGLLRVVVCVELGADRAPELAHDGDAFHALYAEGSSRTGVAGGYRFVLRRADGWYAAPHPLIFAVDLAGQEL